MNLPLRLTRSRAKGARLVSPDGRPVKYIGRGSKWGNPFVIQRHSKDWWDVFSRLAVTEDGDWLLVDGAATWERAALIAVDRYVLRLRTTGLDAEARRELRGCHCACWCKQPQPGHPDLCHGAPLIEIANS